MMFVCQRLFAQQAMPAERSGLTQDRAYPNEPGSDEVCAVGATCWRWADPDARTMHRRDPGDSTGSSRRSCWIVRRRLTDKNRSAGDEWRLPTASSSWRCPFQSSPPSAQAFAALLQYNAIDDSPRGFASARVYAFALLTGRIGMGIVVFVPS